MNSIKAVDRSLAVRFNRWLLWLSRHWLRIVLLGVTLYIGLPFAAPVLMHVGATGPASAIYTVYSPLCHQFAFRSWFLFGEQPAYPRAQANVPILQPFESYSVDLNAAPGLPKIAMLNEWTADLLDLSRGFLGNARMGYKVALCERDVAIYLALLAGGLLYALPYVRRRLRPVPLWLYILLGILPIGIDGFSQLLSEPPFSWWPARETTPAFRTLTGALFGLMNAWMAFPYLDESMRQSAAVITAKFARRNNHPSP